MTTPHRLTPHDERRVAVAAGCDPRTVRSVLAGAKAHSTTTARVLEAMRSLGLADDEIRGVSPEPEIFIPDEQPSAFAEKGKPLVFRGTRPNAEPEPRKEKAR